MYNVRLELTYKNDWTFAKELKKFLGLSRPFVDEASRRSYYESPRDEKIRRSKARHRRQIQEEEAMERARKYRDARSNW